MYDLIIQHGRLLDPHQQLDAPRDVAFSGGRVAAVAEHLEPGPASQLIDARGKLVVPGLVDMHVHGFWGVSHYGVDPDAAFLASGVTTALEAGSAGADTFAGLRRFVLEPSAVRLYALLNISGLGMISEQVGELADLRYADPERAVKVVEANRDVILGIKARLSASLGVERDLEALQRAREAADAARLPLVVHANGSRSPLPPIIRSLRAGDVLTHCFHGGSHGILDGDGGVLPEVREAVERGVWLDVGHGQASFSFAVARRALDQGIVPSVISSDLHSHSVFGPVYDLPTTLSKFLHLGMELSDVIARATVAPAKWLKREGELGTLRPGACGDAVVLELSEGEHQLQDCVGETVSATHRLLPAAVVRAGALVDRAALALRPVVP